MATRELKDLTETIRQMVAGASLEPEKAPQDAGELAYPRSPRKHTKKCDSCGKASSTLGNILSDTGLTLVRVTRAKKPFHVGQSALTYRSPSSVLGFIVTDDVVTFQRSIPPNRFIANGHAKLRDAGRRASALGFLTEDGVFTYFCRTCVKCKRRHHEHEACDTDAMGDAAAEPDSNEAW